MRCDTQRDVYVIERFGGLDMSRMKKPKKPKGYGGEEFDIHGKPVKCLKVSPTTS